MVATTLTFIQFHWIFWLYHIAFNFNIIYVNVCGDGVCVVVVTQLMKRIGDVKPMYTAASARAAIKSTVSTIGLP